MIIWINDESDSLNLINQISMKKKIIKSARET